MSPFIQGRGQDWELSAPHGPQFQVATTGALGRSGAPVSSLTLDLRPRTAISESYKRILRIVDIHNGFVYRIKGVLCPCEPWNEPSLNATLFA